MKHMDRRTFLGSLTFGGFYAANAEERHAVDRGAQPKKRKRAYLDGCARASKVRERN